MKTFLVGGAVRDQFLNIPIKDRDWVIVGAEPNTLLEQHYTQVGKDFPVFLHPKTKEEYALARTERKTGSGYTGFICEFGPSVTIEQDLERRDLTINAIAQDQDGNIIDPFNGVDDIKAKVLRHVSPAFIEDPLRVLRVARFAARYHHLGFTIAEETQQLMRDIALSGELESLTPERVWTETEKALSEKAARVYFETLRSTQALEVLFPELERLYGVPQRADYHPEVDTGLHTMMVLDQATQLSDDLRVRFAALTHDLGKGTTPADILPRHYGHEYRSVDLVKDVCRRYKIPNQYREIALVVAEFHGLCHRVYDLKASTIAKLFRSIDAYRRPERLSLFLLSCEADYRGRTGFENKVYDQPAFLAKCFEACNEIDLTPLKEKGFKGKEMGEAIDRLRLEKIKSIQAQAT